MKVGLDGEGEVVVFLFLLISVLRRQWLQLSDDASVGILGSSLVVVLLRVQGLRWFVFPLMAVWVVVYCCGTFGCVSREAYDLGRGRIESHAEGMMCCGNGSMFGPNRPDTMLGGLRSAFFFLGRVGDVLAKLQLHNLVIYLFKKM